jgi:hypothetical protein
MFYIFSLNSARDDITSCGKKPGDLRGSMDVGEKVQNGDIKGWIICLNLILSTHAPVAQLD